MKTIKVSVKNTEVKKWLWSALSVEAHCSHPLPKKCSSLGQSPAVDGRRCDLVLLYAESLLPPSKLLQALLSPCKQLLLTKPINHCLNVRFWGLRSLQQCENSPHLSHHLESRTAFLTPPRLRLVWCHSAQCHFSFHCKLSLMSHCTVVGLNCYTCLSFVIFCQV